jgi:SAM-dependent methyltransferase
MSQFVKEGKMLDIGCGTKPYKNFFSRTKYYGLDYRKDGANQNPQADFFYDGGKFPFNDQEFDYALATEVLEHVFEPDFFIQEINRILRPGGLCLLTVPFMWDEHEQPFDFGRYTSFGIRALLERHGFKIIEQRKTGGFISTLGQMFCTYLYYTFSKNRYLYKLSLPLIFAPIQIMTLIMAKILPANDGLYLDNIVLCEKV